MEDGKTKRGRPVRGEAQNNQCKFRTSDEQIRRLKVASQISGRSQSDILREALNKELELLGIPTSNGVETFENYGEFDEEINYDLLN